MQSAAQVLVLNNAIRVLSLHSPYFHKRFQIINLKYHIQTRSAKLFCQMNLHNLLFHVFSSTDNVVKSFEYLKHIGLDNTCNAPLVVFISHKTTILTSYKDDKIGVDKLLISDLRCYFRRSLSAK